MIEEQLNVILERVFHWRRDRQRDAAEMVMLIEEQDSSPFESTDEQVAEVRRRRAETDPELLSHEEFDGRLSRFGL